MCIRDRLYGNLYTADTSWLPAEVTGLSLGCGDPITLAALEPGQTVLDLGSGGGIDCFMAARQVGPTGHVIGVDMTPEMRAKAERKRACLLYKSPNPRDRTRYRMPSSA